MPTPLPGSVEEAQAKLKNLLGGGGLETDVQVENREIEEDQASEQDTQVDETHEDEAASSETQETAEQSEETDVETKDESVEEESDVQTLQELAEAIDLDIDTLYKLKIPLAGDRGEITLGEYKDSIQDNLQIQQERERFETDRKTFETERQQVEQVLLQRLQEADQFLTAFEEALTAEEQKVDWQWLRENNPAEYSAKKAELADQKERLKAQRGQIQQKATEQLQEQQNQLQQQLLTTRVEEEKKLLQRVPEWTDSKVADTEKDQLTTYLKKEGFSDQDIGMTLDHRLIVMARKAMLFDQGTKKVTAAKKRVKKLPKRVKPSSPKSKAGAETDQQKQLRGRLRKTGKLNDAAQLLKSRMQAARKQQ